MKKLILSATVAVLAMASAQGQEIPERKTEPTKPIVKEKVIRKKESADLNLTDEQKTRLKSMNQDLRKQMEELRKKENITVKEYREQMAALRKERQAQFHSMLTQEQKDRMEKNKEAYKARAKEYSIKRQERMKEQLNLTDDQMSKMTENRKAMAEKIKTIRENNALSEDQKRQEIKETLKKQKETMKSLLTDEQLKKMKEHKKEHHKRKRHVVI